MIHKKLPKGLTEDVIDRFQQYKKENFNKIKSPFCNFADYSECLENYKNIIRFSIGNYTPIKIKVVCNLYHGCEKLVDTQVVEE